jgi:LuxR family maltose regulon positive regulatory protein
MTADALLSTKLLMPAARPDQVARARLSARLEDGLRLGHRLTLVSAPPGFGKTTLIREWAGGLGRRIAWLTLDAGDNEPSRFLRYLIAAVEQAEPRVESALPAATPADVPQERLVAFINALSAAGAPLLLVLDDYHLITDFASHGLMAFLLAHQPATLHVVIGTREDPPLPLARLRARDQLTEIRESALRFTAEEAAAFLRHTMGLTLASATVAALTARTEGWITGLQLAGLALRQQSGADEFVAAFAGNDRYIVDYLMAEVLEREPAPMREFLRQTSILERMCAPLCDALTGRDDAQMVLEQLENANLFLIRLDNRREWYRYHVLFAEVLRLSLSAQERLVLHRKAAIWFENHDWPDLAAGHARLAAELAGAAPKRAPAQRLVEPLSEREIEVLQLIAGGLANAEIGRKLYIADGTVKRHINNIYGKLGVGSRTQAIARARALGLIE